MNAERIRIGPLWVSDIGPDELCRHVVDLWTHEPERPQTVLALHVTSVNARRDRAFADSVERASVVYADGFSVELLARLGGAKSARKLATTELGWELLAHISALEHGRATVAIVGGEPGVAEAAAERLRASPWASVLLTSSGYESDWTPVLDRLAAARPNVILLGLGMPLEAEWCARYAARLPHSIVVTCGGWLRILAGGEERAPALLQRLQLEWLYRWVRSPRRVGMRYLAGAWNVSALALPVLAQRLRGRGVPQPRVRYGGRPS